MACTFVYTDPITNTKVNFDTEAELNKYIEANKADIVNKFNKSNQSVDFQRDTKGNLVAPNGKISNLNEVQWKQVRTQAFKNWFGDWENNPETASKGIDENGEPRVYYTGTSKDFDFSTFKVPKNGAWFVTDPRVASTYANENDSQNVVFGGGKYSDTNVAPRVIPVFLNIRNIGDFNKEVTPEQRQKISYSDNYKKQQALYFQNVYYSKPIGERFDSLDYTGDGQVIVILESPNQIKSAIGNKGTFSSTNNNILNQIVGEKSIGKDVEKTRTLNLAKDLEKKDKSALEIFYTTGWEKIDGEWKTEIPYGKIIDFYDVILPTITKFKADDTVAVNLEHIFNAPELYKLYPELKKLEVYFTNKLAEEEGGKFSYTNNKGEIILNKNILNLEGHLKYVLIHELQHFIQYKEGYIDKDDANYINKDDYTFSPIEIEANLAASRSLSKKQKRKDLSFSQYYQDFLEGVNNETGLLFQKDDNSITDKNILAKINKFTNKDVANIVHNIIATTGGESSSAEKDANFVDLYFHLMGMDNAKSKEWNKAVNPTVLKSLLSYRDFREQFKVLSGITDAEMEVLDFNDFGRSDLIANALHPRLLNQEAKGAFDTMQRVIYAVTNPNVSTPLHELAHAWEAQLNHTERQQVLDWAGHKNWTRETSEQFARGFEQYLLEGKTTDSVVKGVFEKFAEWLKKIYDHVVTGLGLQLNDNMRNVYNRMLDVKEQDVVRTNLLMTKEEALNTPNPNSEDFGRVSRVQQAIKSGYYEEQLKNKTLDEGALRQIIKSNGLSDSIIDTILFKANNEAFVKDIEQAIPATKYDKAYLQKMSKAYNEGLLDEAAFKNVVRWEKYYDILNYIGEKIPVTPDERVSEFVKKFYATEPTLIEEAVEPEQVVEQVPARDFAAIKESIYKLTDKELTPAWHEIPISLLLSDRKGISVQEQVFQAYYKSVKNNTHPELVQAVDNALNAPQKKKLFNEPNVQIANIAEEYKKEKGITTPQGERITKIDVEQTKRIADIFEELKNDPNNALVQQAYEAMGRESIDQAVTLINNGYTVEIFQGVGEPYANSEEMTKDLRENKHLFILSTAKEFGETAITEQQRKDNPLLRDSGLKDIKGNSLLVNDAFRFAHDAFGHGERGNQFGAIGEENAWDVHARMFTSLARRAMTTETRGQNSWVNFGKHLRNENGSIKKVAPKKKPYAEQKMVLMPEWVSAINGETTETTPIEEPIIPVIEEAPVEEGAMAKGDFVIYEGATYKELKGSKLKIEDTHESNPNVTEGFVKVEYYPHELPLFSLRKATPEEMQPTFAQTEAFSQSPITETGFSNGDIVTFQGENYTVNYSEPGVALDDKGKEYATTLYNVSKGVKTIVLSKEQITAARPSEQKKSAKNIAFTVMANRFQQIFPQIEVEIDSFDFDAPGRFYKGRVQINTNYQSVDIQKEGIGHEFMHPFVAALKTSNKYLYNNLVKELNATQKSILAEIDAKIEKGLYTQDERTDEALVTYLGREISNAFDELGIPRDYSESKNEAGEREPSFIEQKRMTLVQKFVKWWTDIMDYLLGKRKPRHVDDFVIATNGVHTEDITDFILNNKDEGLKNQYKKHYKVERLVLETDENGKVKKTEGGKGIPILVDGKTVTFRQLYEQQAERNKNFEFAARNNENYGVEFEKNGNVVKVFIDREMFPDMTSIEVLREYGNRMSELFHDNDEFDKYNEEFNTILDNNSLTYPTKEEANKTPISVTALHPRMGLQGVVTLMQANLGKQAISPFEYNEREIGVINELESYLKLNDEQADELKKIRAGIVKKIAALGDIATRRIGEGTFFTKLKEDSEFLSKHNYFTIDDAEFLADYIKHGADSINTAYRMFNRLKDELADKANLDQPRLNRINKEMEQIKQLVAMYDDVSKLTKNYKETFEQDQVDNFTAAIMRLDSLKDNMKQVLAELATEQIMPTIERNNKSLQAQGYDKYVLNRDDVKKLLLFGSQKDIGWFAHMFGAPVNSTDTVNAAIANSIADSLNYVYSNNLDSINQLVDSYTASTQSKLGNKEKAEFYKNNYMRKAKLWDIVSYDAQNKPVYGYIKKYAFHQDKLYDVYEDDLRIFKSNLPVAHNVAEDHANIDKINAWEAANKNNAKYINRDFIRLQGDRYYQSVYGNYVTYNNKYGETRLQFGIIPQFYREDLMDKLKEKWKSVKGIAAKDKDFKERITKIGDEIFGEPRGDKDKRGLNLDGTVYRSVNSDTTSLKDDNKLDFDVHKIMIDFISDAGNYEAKREVQFNMENIKQLLEGNTFFGIEERKIGTQDFAAQFRLQRVAKEKLKVIEADIKNGKVLNATEKDEYEALKEQARGNTFKQVYDKFLGRSIPARTNRANQQAIEFINDVFYNEDEYESHVKVGGRVFDLNKLGNGLGFTQAVVNMAGNIVAGTNNILAGNTQMFIEAFGGKHFTKKDLVLAHAQYTAALLKMDFISDVKNPIKSEITQYGLLFDAIQGEFTNNLGEKISGNLMRKFATLSFYTNNLFILTHAGEHQIQLTGMLALMNATKVKTNAGQEISLKQAFVKDANGRYNLRPDVKWSKDDKQQFVRTLHGVSRTLNGNYNSLHKGHIQRYWYGKLMMQYRKYLYPAIVARYGQERVDREKGTVEMGYFTFFFRDFLFRNLVNKQLNLIQNYKNLTPDQKYWSRKAMTEISLYILLTFAALSMGSGDADKIKKMSDAQKALLLFTIRVHNEIGMYHIDAGTEFLKQSKNPIASMRFVTGVVSVAAQMFHPAETYDRDGNGYKEGDSKLGKKFHKLIPKLITAPMDKFQIDWDNYLSYQSLVQQMPR